MGCSTFAVLRMVHFRLSGMAKVVHQRLRRVVWPVAQAAVACGMAWYIAHDLLGHPQPFFAPVAATVSLGASGIMRGQRSLQLITGVALGIVIGTGVQAVVGVGPVALGVAAFVSMCLAAVIGRNFVGAGAMFVNQTASSAILVIALHRTGTGSERLVDALIGGGVALTMAVLLFPAAPLPLIRDATQAVFAALGEALDHLGEVLAGRTGPDAAWTLSTGQHIHGRLATLTDAHTTAVRIVRLAPLRWRDRVPVRRAEAHWGELNLLAGTVLSLLRVADAAVRADVAVPSPLRESISDLAAALNVLAGQGPAGVSDFIAAANHAAALIDPRPLSTEGYLRFIGLLTRAGVADLGRAVQPRPDGRQVTGKRPRSGELATKGVTVTEPHTFTFTGARGDRLTARLDLPDGKPRAVVLVAHCFSGGNAGLAAAQVARSFSELGLAVLSLDFAPAGHDGEQPASAAFSVGVGDLAIAAAQLRSTMAAPSILVGHSLGGAAVLAIAARVPEARAVVTLATPAEAAQAADLGQAGAPGAAPAHRRVAPGTAGRPLAGRRGCGLRPRPGHL